MPLPAPRAVPPRGSSGGDGRRSAQSAPRRRSTDPPLRRREDDHRAGRSVFGSLVTAAAALLFLGYECNMPGFAAAAHTVFSNLNASGPGEQVFSTGLGLLAAALILFGILRFVLPRFLFPLFRSARKSRAPAERSILSLEHFKRITEARGIHPHIAMEAYELLLPFYDSSRNSRLDDRLLEDLHMTSAQVQDTYSKLLRKTDRKRPAEETIPVVTVMDLLQAVQGAKRQSLMDFVPRRAHAQRASDTEEKNLSMPR